MASQSCRNCPKAFVYGFEKEIDDNLGWFLLICYLLLGFENSFYQRCCQ